MRLFVTELADSKREIERGLNDATEPVLNHLLKLYLMSNSESRNHWITEIFGFLNKIKKLAGKNKFPSKDQIYDWTYNKWEDVLTDDNYLMDSIESIEDIYNINIDENIRTINIGYNRLCRDYFSWLANELSQYGRVTFSMVRTKLNELV